MHLRLVQRSLPPPRRHPTCTAQIHVRSANQHGRSRPFHLDPESLGRLLETAAELERANKICFRNS
jgi:hypothetical protein